MENKKTILLHNITPDELKEMIISDLKIEIEKLLAETKKEKPLEYLTRQEVAKILKISLVTISDWSRIGIIKPYRLGNLVRFKSNELDDALIRIEKTHRR